MVAEGVAPMSIEENYRLIEGLQSAGWTAEGIIDFIKYVESGDEQYKPGNHKD